ncbi:peptide-methionine (R)-S-oxide reductase MsrB [Thermoflexibacter ruber]|uniref:Peptide methionine sulfoxide reductase MsrB n=1 Tax=Thermoflexibacter ruber TaxID=1003 RepID=A0A1I2HFE9_9BACT|nr:peptide-methionine (R)-S-oxide reductase MsrB [Thermoflexibacter ruber]SFF27231.1 SelR domain-containing protein [Thermoflexibacter ruber]
MKNSLIKIYFLATLLFSISSCSHAQNQSNTQNSKNTMDESKWIIKDKTLDNSKINPNDKVTKTEEEWKKILTPEQFQILRKKGTEYAFTGKFYKHKEKGIYICAGCGNELFTSEQKYDSGCGWPSFYDAVAAGKIKTALDTSHGMIRTEIMCARCDGHLGHVFEDGPNPTGLRYCVNSLSIDFKKKEEK